MIIREFDPDSSMALVTFALPEDAVPGGSISVVGDFNDWDPHAHPLQEADGWRRASLRIPTGRRYRFRYLNEPDQWLNDAEADAYEPNPHGGDDAVLDLTDPERWATDKDPTGTDQDNGIGPGLDTTGIATELTAIAVTGGAASARADNVALR